MSYYATIETKQDGKNIKERSQDFTNQLACESWLHSACSEARNLGIKIVDHYLSKSKQ